MSQGSPREIDYLDASILPGAAVGIPSLLLSSISFSAPSTPDHVSALRAFEVAGVHVFDYAGSTLPAAAVAFATTGVGMLAERYISKKEQRPAVVAGAMALTSVGVSVGFEAITADRMDVGDAAVGSATGLLYTTLFCISALRQRARARKTR